METTSSGDDDDDDDDNATALKSKCKYSHILELRNPAGICN
jgi:hypothetical protein